MSKKKEKQKCYGYGCSKANPTVRLYGCRVDKWWDSDGSGCKVKQHRHARMYCAECTESVLALRKRLPRGTTIYTILRRVSRSGMFRVIDLRYISRPNKKRGWKQYIARVWDERLSQISTLSFSRDSEGFNASGFGMDMGFHLVYNLGDAVYGDGYAFKHEWL